MRFTTNNPKSNVENALNLFFIKDHETFVRGGGPAPHYEDVSLYDFIRRIIGTHDLNIPVVDKEELGEALFERLFDGTDTMEGVVALLYTAGWAFSEIRGKLEEYEDASVRVQDVPLVDGVIDIERINPDPCKPKTLGDMLRSMSDEKLAQWITDWMKRQLKCNGIDRPLDPEYKETVLKHLQGPAKEANHG